jgi:hypothetical protein
MLGGEHGEDEPTLGTVQLGLPDQPPPALDRDIADDVDPDCHASNQILTRSRDRPLAATKEAPMELEVSCDCGWSFRGPEARVIVETQDHARRVHELEISEEQARAAARPVSTPPARGD